MCVTGVFPCVPGSPSVGPGRLSSTAQRLPQLRTRLGEPVPHAARPAPPAGLAVNTPTQTHTHTNVYVTNVNFHPFNPLFVASPWPNTHIHTHKGTPMQTSNNKYTHKHSGHQA